MLRWTVHLKRLEAASGKVVTVGHCVYCFGRDPSIKEKQIDVHIFNTLTLIWRKLIPVPAPGREHLHLQVPTRRRDHTAVFIEDIVYLWGGCECYTDSYCNVLHAFDVNTHTWFKPHVSGTVPEARGGHCACVLRKDMFIHGGYIQGIGHTDDTYKLHTSSMCWTLIHTRGTEPPATRLSATIIGTKMFVFGGWGCHYSNYKVFDTESNLWLDTPSAQFVPRHDGQSVFVYNGEMYILCAYNRYQVSNDLWKFSPETFSGKKVKPKGKGLSPAFKIQWGCMLGDRVIVFGRNSTYNLYILDLSPSLKTLCKLAVSQYRLDPSGLPHNIRWELAAMTNGNEMRRNTSKRYYSRHLQKII